VSVSVAVVGVGSVDDESGGDERGVGRDRGLIIVAGLAVLVLAAATWIVAFSPMLGANGVTVRGTRQLTIAQVRDAAAIKHGSPLVRLDTAAVRRRVESLPMVASAAVRTDYPSTVVITVTERVAVGYVRFGSRYLLVDKTGAQYQTVASEPRSLPLFVVPGGPDAQATGRAVATMAASLTRELRAHVTSVQAFDPTSITLLLADQRVVRWGSADRSADKARILPFLLRQPGSTFDVTDPEQVVTH
jgi:cell division protein FtsQ